MPEGGRPAARYRLVLAFCIVSTLIVLSPIYKNFTLDWREDFPLSHYPMFTTVRGETTRLYHAVARMRDGTQRHLNYRLMGRGGMNQTRKKMRRLVRRGAAGQICQNIARRIARSRSPVFEGVFGVEVVASDFPINVETVRNPVPASQKLWASCLVNRSRRR